MPELANPTVALGIKPVQPIQSNPFELLRGMADTQSALLGAENAKRILSAKQKAGSIMQAAPTLEEGINALALDPEVSGYVPDIISTLQGVSGAMTSQQGAIQDQSLSGLAQVIKMVGSTVSDPRVLEGGTQAILETLSPSAAPRVRKAYGAVVKSLTDGLLKLPPEKRLEEYQKRAAAMFVGSGGDESAIRAQLGTIAPSVSMQPVGTEGETVPVQTGGGMTEKPSAKILDSGESEAPISTLSPAELKLKEKQGEVAGEFEQEYAGITEALPSIKRIDMMQTAMSKAQLGGGADIRISMGKTLQALKNAGFDGITQENIDNVGNSDLAASQLFDALVKPMLISELSDISQHLGKASANEINTYMASMEATTDPKTVMQLLNKAKYDIQVEYDKANKYAEFKKLLKAKDPSVADYDGPSDFGLYYINTLDPNSLPQATPGGINLAPTPVEKAKGAVPDKTESEDKESKLKRIFGE